MTLFRNHGLLWLALAAHAVLATLYAVTTPAFEGPDENDHCYYAAYLRHTGTLPRISDEPPMTGGSLAHHPPLYYALVNLGLDALGVDDAMPAWRSNPSWASSADDARVHWLHGHDEREPISREIHTLRFMRLLSVLCGLASITLTYALARIVFPADAGTAGAAALLLACTPQWSWLHGCVENGNLATALSLGAVVVLARGLRARDFGPAKGLAAGLLTGLALITKLTSVFLLPLLALAYGWTWWRQRSARRRTVGSALGAGGVLAAVSGWCFWRNLDLYGDPLAMSAHRTAFASNLVPEGQLFEYLTGHFPASTFATCFAGFGWATVQLPTAALFAIGAILCFAAFGWLRAGRELCQSGGAPLALIAAAAVLVTASLVRFNLTYLQPQGRYLFPAYGPFAILIAAGLLAPVGPFIDKRWRAVFVALPLVAAGVAWSTVFLPLWRTLPEPPDRFYASMVEGMGTPPSAARGSIEPLEPNDDASLREPPTFRWSNPDHVEGDRYSVHIVLPSGLPIGTYESGLIEIAAQEWTMPEALWQSLAADQAFTWKVRRLPDRSRVEQVTDVPESPLRRLTRRR